MISASLPALGHRHQLSTQANCEFGRPDFVLRFQLSTARLSTFSSLSIESMLSQMTDQPPSDRFKSEMPQIPGVSGSRATTAPNPAVKLVIGLLAVLLMIFLGARALRPKRVAPQARSEERRVGKEGMWWGI